ncbi:uncharacterized protein LOC107856384 isoform X3 [Capsicum annuum]|uniref:uncharacterized protein LOC107856384 isoform X3 n=1 Tax=Capsicum annuum TaxID=4072 RepID=UPI001FB0758F|nr:uncharacterized protein LOC107856384 isoform X3 [Capsicum annuum]
MAGNVLPALGRVKLSDLIALEGLPSDSYKLSVSTLSQSLAQYSAAIIQLSTSDGALLRSSIESARLYFQHKPSYPPADVIHSDDSKTSGYHADPQQWQENYDFRPGLTDKPGLHVRDFLHGHWVLVDGDLGPQEAIVYPGLATAGYISPALHRTDIGNQQGSMYGRCSLSFKLMPKSMTNLNCSEMRAAGHGVEAQFQLPVPVDDFMQRSTDQLLNRNNFPTFNFPTAQEGAKRVARSTKATAMRCVRGRAPPQGCIVRSLTLHFYQRLFPRLEPVVTWQQLYQLLQGSLLSGVHIAIRIAARQALGSLDQVLVALIMLISCTFC